MQVKQKSNGVGMAWHTVYAYINNNKVTLFKQTPPPPKVRDMLIRHDIHYTRESMLKLYPCLICIICTYPLETVLEVWWIDLIETLIHNYLLRQMKNNNSIAQINLSTQNYDIFFNVFQSQKYYNIVCSFGW